MSVETLERWVRAYCRAWESNEPTDIAALYSEGARYYQRPYFEPVEGRDAIVADWLERRDEPGDHRFRYEILGADGDTGFVRGWTSYADPPIEYSNLWVVRLDESGQATEFIEWWMDHATPAD